MLHHYIISAYRSLTRHATSFWINVVGLSTGMATSLMIFLWVADEIKVDTFHENDERLFQVMSTREFANGQSSTSMATFGLLAAELKNELPEVEQAATYTWQVQHIFSQGNSHFKQQGIYASKDFLTMTSFPLLHGDKSLALSDKRGVVLSRPLAEKLFEDPARAVNQIVTIDHDRTYKVTAVLDDIPSTSSRQFDFIASFDDFVDQQPWVLDWRNQGPRTLVLLSKETSTLQVGEKIQTLHAKHLERDHARFSLIQMSDLYLWNSFENGVPVGGRIDNIRLFSAVAVFILLIACINFINLSTARASSRAQEVGIRKVIGAERPMLIKQYLSESVVVTTISMLFALGILSLILPMFNEFTGKVIEFNFTPELVTGSLAIALFTGILAGSYPALYLSSYRAILVIKGEFRASPKQVWIRKGLVIFQFWLSIIFIAAVVVIQSQVQYIADKDVGYDNENLVYFEQSGNVSQSIDTYLEELSQLPGVQDASSVGHTLVGMQNYTSEVSWRGKSPADQMQFEVIRVNYGLIETVGMRMKSGRTFSKAKANDQTGIVVNEAAVAAMGMEEPVGKKLTVWGEQSLEIIGVVENFHFQSLRQKHSPAIILLRPEASWFIMARLMAGREAEAITQMKDFNDSFNPGFPIEPKFVDEVYYELYSTEQRVASLSKYAAALAIIISCLGLLGLASFTAERRIKEIGIRKALGAKAANIAWLLTTEFTRLVIWAILLAVPVAYWILRHWLDQFEYRIDLSVGFFLCAAIIAMVISWITLSAQAIRTAMVNPSDCLRDE